MFDDELFRLAVVVGRRFVFASGRSLPPSLFGLLHVLLFEIDGGGGGRSDGPQWVGEARRRIESIFVRVRDCGIGGVEVIVGAENSSDAMRQLSIVCRCVATAFDDYRALAVTKRCVCVDCARSGVLDTCVIDATDIAMTTEPVLSDERLSLFSIRGDVVRGRPRDGGEEVDAVVNEAVSSTTQVAHGAKLIGTTCSSACCRRTMSVRFT